MRVKDTNKLNNIKNAVVYLVNNEGLSCTTMKRISEQAKVSIATPYIYFKNQEDMINQIFLDLEQKISSSILNIFDKDIEVKQNIKNIWFFCINYFKENLEEIKFLETLRKHPIINAESKLKLEEIFSFLTGYIKLAQNNKQIQEAPISIIIHLLFMNNYNLIIFQEKEKEIKAEDYYEKTFELLWNSIKR